MKVTVQALQSAAGAAIPLLLPALAFAAAGGGGHEMTTSDILWDLGIKTLNVAILGFLAFKFLSRPLNAFVEARSEKIRRELEEATSGRREAEERLRLFQEKTAGIEAEIEGLRKQTCVEIDKEQKILLEEARGAAEHIRQHARDTIRQEVLKGRDELHREAVRLAAEMAEEMIRGNITGADHQRLAGEYLKEMEAKK